MSIFFITVGGDTRWCFRDYQVVLKVTLLVLGIQPKIWQNWSMWLIIRAPSLAFTLVLSNLPFIAWWQLTVSVKIRKAANRRLLIQLNSVSSSTAHLSSCKSRLVGNKWRCINRKMWTLVKGQYWNILSLIKSKITCNFMVTIWKIKCLHLDFR